MHYPLSLRFGLGCSLPAVLGLGLMIWAPDLAMAQASPFMTGASSLQTNARVAREYLVALPAELSPAERIGLVKGFSQELADRYRFAVDCAIHAPRDFPGSDPRNFHAHLLATTREVTTEGLGAKTTLEWNDGSRREIGLRPVIYELLHVRQRWAAATNEVLREAHLEVRIDHRTLRAQGIDREPRPQIPKAAFELERHGYRSVVAERMRNEYAARLEARLQRSSGRDAIPANPQSLEEIRRQARENWLQMRRGQAESAPRDPLERAKDDDLAR